MEADFERLTESRDLRVLIKEKMERSSSEFETEREVQLS